MAVELGARVIADALKFVTKLWLENAIDIPQIIQALDITVVSQIISREISVPISHSVRFGYRARLMVIEIDDVHYVPSPFHLSIRLLDFLIVVDIDIFKLHLISQFVGALSDIQHSFDNLRSLFSHLEGLLVFIYTTSNLHRLHLHQLRATFFLLKH